MTQGHKIIKGLAIALAVFIIVSILSAIVYGIVGLISIFTNEENLLDNPNIIKIEEKIDVIDIEIGATNLIIKDGEEFKVETNDGDIIIDQEGSTLKINEKNSKKLISKSKSKLTIYIPKEESVDQLILELGAGNVSIENIEVRAQTEIQGGAGNIEISSSILNNIDFELGVGNVDLEAYLYGENSIECGVGNLDLNLLNEDDYKVSIEKGVGTISVNDKKAKNNTTIGNGDHIIDIEGGVGNIDVITK